MMPRRAGSDEAGPAASSQPLRQALGFERQMHLHALRLTRSDADAADLVQDTFERALRNWHRLRPGTDVRLWLLKVMSTLHASRQRAAATPSTSLEHLPPRALLVPEPVPLPSWQLYSMKDVAEALKTLPPGLAKVYRLKMLRHLPTDAVVEQLHIPRPTVARWLVRALSRIRTALDARGPRTAADARAP
jgi:RNA polymerase sigma-70 factor (ECF subfamily)